MKNLVKTSGIILRRFDLNEADQIVTVLTQNYGKVSLIAKGSRRIKSKFCGRLEPFYQVELVYFQGRELGHLDEAELSDASPCLDMNLLSKGVLFYMSEVTLKLLPDGQECGEVYEILTEALQRFEESRSELILYAYIIKLLTVLGFMAPWDTCSRSNTKLNLNEPLYLSTRDASIVRSGFAEGSELRLTPSVIKWVNYMQKESFATLSNVAPSQGEKAEVWKVMESIFLNLLPSPFKSRGFLLASGH